MPHPGDREDVQARPRRPGPGRACARLLDVVPGRELLTCWSRRWVKALRGAQDRSCLPPRQLAVTLHPVL